MPEAMLRQSPLAGLGLLGRGQAERGTAEVAMAERPFPGILDLRGDPKAAGFMAAAQKALGFALPTDGGTTAGGPERRALWLGPNEWWIVTPQVDAALAAALRETLVDEHAAVTEIGDSRTCIRVSGPRATDLIAKGCPLDLHTRSFSTGRCAQTVLAKSDVTLQRIDDEPSYDLFVLCSFADYLWRWLEDAAQEYGLAILSE